MEDRGPVIRAGHQADDSSWIRRVPAFAIIIVCVFVFNIFIIVCVVIFNEGEAASFVPSKWHPFEQSLPERYLNRSVLDEELRAKLASKTLVTVSGCPGCGKSSLVLSYALSESHRLKYIVWLDETDLHSSVWAFYNGWASFCCVECDCLVVVDNARAARNDSFVKARYKAVFVIRDSTFNAGDVHVPAFWPAEAVSLLSGAGLDAGSSRALAFNMLYAHPLSVAAVAVMASHATSPEERSALVREFFRAKEFTLSEHKAVRENWELAMLSVCYVAQWRLRRRVSSEPRAKTANAIMRRLTKEFTLRSELADAADDDDDDDDDDEDVAEEALDLLATLGLVRMESEGKVVRAHMLTLRTYKWTKGEAT